MRIVELDAKDWADVIDFYNAMKRALCSSPGHGSSPDAWIDSMIYGGMNALEPPYVIRITGTANCNDELKTEIVLLSNAIREARVWRLKHYGDDVNVSFEIDT